MDNHSSDEVENKPNGSGLLRIFKATQCSIQGFKAAYINESAFRQEFWLVVILTPLAWFTSQTFSDFVVLMAVMLMVLMVELLNSAIEAVVDRVGFERHELSGRTKDLGSAAVSIALAIASLFWLSHLYTYFFV